MDIASRIRRQREFLEFFIEKLQKPDPYQGCCYFCEKPVDQKSFNLSLDDVDPLTIHHVSEVREDNRIENRVLCHKACHQEYHKLATKMGLPAMVVREMMVEERRKVKVVTSPISA